MPKFSAFGLGGTQIYFITAQAIVSETKSGEIIVHCNCFFPPICKLNVIETETTETQIVNDLREQPMSALQTTSSDSDSSSSGNGITSPTARKGAPFTEFPRILSKVASTGQEEELLSSTSILIETQMIDQDEVKTPIKQIITSSDDSEPSFKTEVLEKLIAILFSNSKSN